METSDNQRILKIIDKLQSLKMNPQIFKVIEFNDEPRFFFYTTTIKLTSKHTDGLIKGKRPSGLGTSFFSPHDAFLKSLYEIVERASNYSYKRKNVRYAIYKDNIADFIDPCLFLSHINIRNQNLGWVEGYNLLTHKKYFLPAQLIFLNYAKHKDEPPLPYPQNSTGTAAGSNPEHAILNGIYEAVERDAFVTLYLNRISPPKISLDKINDKRINYILEQCSRYKLKLSVLDITNDIGIPSFLSILTDNKDNPPVALGAKSGLRVKNAILGAIMEAFMIRMSTRHMVQNGIIFGENTENGDVFADRARHWMFPGMIKKLDFLFSGPLSNKKIKVFQGNVVEEFSAVANILYKKNFEIYVVDITMREFKDLDIFTYKVLIPGLQPLYLDEHEKYKAKDTARLKTVASFYGKKYTGINRLPHPFL